MGTVPVRFVRRINADITDNYASINTLRVCVGLSPFFQYSHLATVTYNAVLNLDDILATSCVACVQ